jgi:hypothetical protein
VKITDFLSDKIITFPKYQDITLNKMATDGSETVIYKMNEHGYRSESIYKEGDINILILGCSWTLGIGVNFDDIWPNIVGSKFDNSMIWNYSMYGTSVEFISKQYYKILKSGFRPDIILLLWPGFSRRDYLREDGKYRRIGGWRRAYDPNDSIFRNDKEDLAFLTLQNDYQDLHIFWNSYKLVEQTNINYKIPTFHSVAGYYYKIFEKYYSMIINFIDEDTFFIPENCHINDKKAIDCSHPGPKWHKQFGNEFYTFIKDKI